MPPLRIGLIGAGANTRQMHIPGFRKVDHVEVTAVANRSRASGERVAAEFGIPRVFDSVEALCADRGIDAVCIGTWPYKHREYTILALEAGKHVLCEARMARDLAEAEEMLAASQRHPGLVAQLVPAPFDFRLGPTITRMIAEGALGQVREVTVTILNGSGLDPATPLHWRQRADYSGKNVMMFGIFVEVIHRWLGDHTRVAADGQVVIPERLDAETGRPGKVEVPDTYGVLGRLANGARITYTFSSVAAGSASNGVSVFGTKGTIRWSMGDKATFAVHGEQFADVEPDPGTDRGWCVEEDFVASVREGAPVRLTNFADGVRYMKVIDGAYESWKQGRAVDL
jgi:predicted dehydrogenase